MHGAPSRLTFRTIADWIWEGRRFAAATLVETSRSEFAALGETLAVDALGNAAGTIGAGNDDEEIVILCLRTLEDGILREFRVVDEYDAAIRVVTWVPSLDFGAVAIAIADGAQDVLFSVPARPPVSLVIPCRRDLVVAGSTTLGREIGALGTMLDLRVIVVDSRRISNDELDGLLVHSPPVIVASNDAEIDVRALRCALRSTSPYIALFGNGSALQKRYESLRNEGFDDAALSRIRTPGGADSHARTLAEAAFVLLADVIAARSAIQSNARVGVV